MYKISSRNTIFLNILMIFGIKEKSIIFDNLLAIATNIPVACDLRLVCGPGPRLRFTDRTQILGGSETKRDMCHVPDNSRITKDFVLDVGK